LDLTGLSICTIIGTEIRSSVDKSESPFFFSVLSDALAFCAVILALNLGRLRATTFVLGCWSPRIRLTFSSAKFEERDKKVATRDTMGRQVASLSWPKSIDLFLQDISLYGIHERTTSSSWLHSHRDNEWKSGFTLLGCGCAAAPPQCSRERTTAETWSTWSCYVNKDTDRYLACFQPFHHVSSSKSYVCRRRDEKILSLA
jgi:hypothetical protein